jgi:hypothetical protein
MCQDIVDRLHDVERRAELLEHALRVIRDNTYAGFDGWPIYVDAGGPCAQHELADYIDEVLRRA